MAPGTERVRGVYRVVKTLYGSVEQYVRGFVMRIKCYTITISQSLLGNVVLFYFDS